MTLAAACPLARSAGKVCVESAGLPTKEARRRRPLWAARRLAGSWRTSRRRRGLVRLPRQRPARRRCVEVRARTRPRLRRRTAPSTTSREPAEPQVEGYAPDGPLRKARSVTERGLDRTSAPNRHSATLTRHALIRTMQVGSPSAGSGGHLGVCMPVRRVLSLRYVLVSVVVLATTLAALPARRCPRAQVPRLSVRSR